MATLLLIIHVAVCIALIITVLLQRSEGGALGIGGGAAGTTGRSSANLMTKTTAVLAASFFLTSIALTIIARNGANTESKIDSIKVDTPVSPTTPLVTPKPEETKTPPKAQDGPVIPTPEK